MVAVDSVNSVIVPDYNTDMTSRTADLWCHSQLLDLGYLEVNLYALHNRAVLVWRWRHSGALFPRTHCRWS